MELLRQLLDRERYGEEVKRVPGPSQETDEEEHPLLEVEHGDQLEGVGRLVHGRLERRNASRCVPPHARLRFIGMGVVVR